MSTDIYNKSTDTSSPSRVFAVCSLEQMRLIRRVWLYGILLVQCLG
jgi:hypothetical protein